MNIKGILREFMIREFNESGFHESIGDDESLIESGILDSLSILKLISFMDERFDIMPPEDELKPEKLETLNLIALFIAQKLESK
jgi:acyl carrier protein